MSKGVVVIDEAANLYEFYKTQSRLIYGHLQVVKLDTKAICCFLLCLNAAKLWLPLEMKVMIGQMITHVGYKCEVCKRFIPAGKEYKIFFLDVTCDKHCQETLEQSRKGSRSGPGKVDIIIID